MYIELSKNVWKGNHSVRVSFSDSGLALSTKTYWQKQKTFAFFLSHHHTTVRLQSCAVIGRKMSRREKVEISNERSYNHMMVRCRWLKIDTLHGHALDCANKDLWGLCTPIFIIVVYCRTATSYYFRAKEYVTGISPTILQ